MRRTAKEREIEKYDYESGSGFNTEELFHFSRLITMGQLSACFAHEVSNPLTLIRGHLRFIDESLTVGHPLRAHLEVIDRASRRIEQMAKNMLDFSKKKTRRLTQCEIGELLAEALRFIEPYTRTKFIDVRVQLDSNLPYITVDRWPLVQAIVNVLQNAGEAMADVNPRLLGVKACVLADNLRIAISDNGTGIPSSDLPNVFKPFFTTKGDHGTGLGLFITQQVIREHRGRIEIQNENPGTTFIISLPL
jgi:two-component system NtrC family sensor kinase